MEVIGSIGILLKALEREIISREEAFKTLEKLAKVMWLSVGIYEEARKAIADKT